MVSLYCGTSRRSYANVNQLLELNQSIDLLNKTIQKRKVWNPHVLGDSKVSGSEPLKKQVGTSTQAEMGQNTKISVDTKVTEEIRRTKQEFR